MVLSLASRPAHSPGLAGGPHPGYGFTWSGIPGTDAPSVGIVTHCFVDRKEPVPEGATSRSFGRSCAIFAIPTTEHRQFSRDAVASPAGRFAGRAPRFGVCRRLDAAPVECGGCAPQPPFARSRRAGGCRALALPGLSQVPIDVKKGALWFSRADLLGDPLEGSFTHGREIERQRLLEHPPEGRTRKELEDVFRHNARVTAEFLLKVYINCWHRGSHESMALWRGYGSGPYAIAVRTTFGRLDSLLPGKFSGSGIVPGGAPAEADDEPPHAMPIFLTQVRYIDHSSIERLKDENNMFTPFAFKSVSYRHESEVRAVYWNVPRVTTAGPVNPPGLFVPVDLRALVTDIVVSPLAPDWFEAVVRSASEKYGFLFAITPSLTSRDAVH